MLYHISSFTGVADCQFISYLTAWLMRFTCLIIGGFWGMFHSLDNSFVEAFKCLMDFAFRLVQNV